MLPELVDPSGDQYPGEFHVGPEPEGRVPLPLFPAVFPPASHMKKKKKKVQDVFKHNPGPNFWSCDVKIETGDFFFKYSLFF